MSERSETTGTTCPDCQTIHESSAVIAVGRFDPAGIHGYRPRSGGELRATRAEAMNDVCASRRPDPYDEPIGVFEGTRWHMHSEPICADPDCVTYLTRSQMATARKGA